MKLKRLAALVLSSAMVLSMAACSGNSATNETPGTQGDVSGESTTTEGASTTPSAMKPDLDAPNTQTTDETLKVILGSEPSVAYGVPVGKTENEEEMIKGAILDTLIKKDYATGELKPNLATAWEWVDGTHLKLTLRDDVTMYDGTPLVADDVVYSVNLWMTQSASNDTGKFLAGAEKVDDQTVIIEWNTEAPDFTTLLSWSSFGIVTEDEINAVGGFEAASINPQVGCGKYKFVEWNRGQSIKLTRNEEYWNPEYKGYYKDIVITFAADGAAREMAVEAGDADVTVDIPAAQASAYVESEAVNTYIYTTGQETHLWYNMGENAGPTKDAKVRKAIDKALDFDAIALVGTAGFDTAALSYFGPTSSYYQPNYTAEERAVDIEGAKALLAEAGYADGLEITAVGLPDAVPYITVMQANLAEAGIKLNIESPDVPTFVEAAFGGDYDLICVGDLTSYRTPASICPFLTKVNVEGPGKVIGGPKWTTDEIDAQIKKIITQSDEAQLVEDAKAFDEMIKAETICSNLFCEQKTIIAAKDLKGVSQIQRGYLDLTTMYK